MNHRFIRSVKAKGTLSGLLIPIGVFGALVLLYVLFPAPLRDVAYRVALPLWRAERAVTDSVAGLLSLFTAKKKLIDDIEHLSSELKKAETLLLDRELMRQENEVLQAELGRIARSGNRVLAAILTRPPHSPYDSVVIDVGSANGVRVGDRAFSGSAALGIVAAVFSRTSLVQFFSTAGKKTEVLILHDEASIPVEAEGMGGGEFRAVLPREVSVRAGDLVVLPEFAPRLFANVEAVEAGASDSFQTVRFRNPVSLWSLRLLEVEQSSVEN